MAAILLVCVFATLLPTATVLALAAPQQLLPICCRAHGAHACIMGVAPGTTDDSAPALRQPACPYGQSLRALTTAAMFADFSAPAAFELAVSNIDRQWLADAIATRVLLRSVPRGPPSLFSV